MQHYNEFLRFQWFLLTKIQDFTIWIIISISNFQVIAKGGVLFLLGLLLAFYWPSTTFLFSIILIQMIEF